MLPCVFAAILALSYASRLGLEDKIEGCYAPSPACRKPCVPCPPSEIVDCRGPCDESCYRELIMDLDFYKNIPVWTGANPTWKFFNLLVTDPAGLTNDGILTFSRCGGILNSNPFTHWWGPSFPRELDDIKFLLTTVNNILVPSSGHLFFDWHGTAHTFKTEENPFPETVLQGINDYRLAAAVFNVQSTINGIAFVFLLTNDRVYAVYRRTPYHRQSFGNYYGFSYFIPLTKRKPCDWHYMRIDMDANKKTAAWFLEGKKLLQVKPGYKPLGSWIPTHDFGGEQMDGWPSEVAPAFGTVTDLSAYPAPIVQGNCGASCSFPPIREGLVLTGDITAQTSFPEFNPILGEPNLPSYWDSVGTDRSNHIWGQGVVLGIKQLRVAVEEC